MELIKYAIDFFVNLHDHLIGLFNYFGIWAFLIVFLIIFCETGLVVTPFLPGDSLMFLLGALAASGEIKYGITPMYVVLIVAAILGNISNYYIGKKLGRSLFDRDNIRFFNRKNLIKAQGFFEKYGSKTIIITRFVPIVRTFAPFAAGMGCMSQKKFMIYNLIGGIAWVILFVTTGFFFGSMIPEKLFSVIVLAIVAISLVPIIIEYLLEKNRQKKQANKEQA